MKQSIGSKRDYAEVIVRVFTICLDLLVGF